MELLPPAFVDAFIPNFLTPTKARRNDRDASVSPVRWVSFNSFRCDVCLCS